MEPWNFMTFHSVGNFIIPTVTHSIIFQRGWLKPPSSVVLEVLMERLIQGDTPSIHFCWGLILTMDFFWEVEKSVHHQLIDGKHPRNFSLDFNHNTVVFLGFRWPIHSMFWLNDHNGSFPGLPQKQWPNAMVYGRYFTNKREVKMGVIFSIGSKTIFP